uniref:Uncharacterized protein n=1 Tax=Lepeophtheirus salmonis TaxID=72036 RepID=A0A0K2TSR4_LEPSM
MKRVLNKQMFILHNQNQYFQIMTLVSDPLLLIFSSQYHAIFTCKNELITK